MVKTKFKKAVSLVLAAVMSLTAFMGIGATTAFAAVGEKADVYLVDYPRSGDTNNNGEWGHGNLNYMNGWKGLSTKYTGLRAMGSYSGNIAYCKVDEDYPDNKLTGATFEVYKDVNGDGKLDDGDELIGTLNESSTGIYEMKELLYGKYLVRETKAPEGFELDKGVYSVFIEEDEMTYEVENKAGVGFINTAMKGSLKIVKTSSDGKVEGFTFRVTGVNGYDRSFTTDKNGEIVIEGLRIGDYTVSEVQDSVSASYVLPADKIATVKVGSTTVVEMHNELRDTPKTGDNSNVGLWTALAGLSALGIAGTAIVAYRKKKKEDNE